MDDDDATTTSTTSSTSSSVGARARARFAPLARDVDACEAAFGLGASAAELTRWFRALNSTRGGGGGALPDLLLAKARNGVARKDLVSERRSVTVRTRCPTCCCSPRSRRPSRTRATRSSSSTR